MIRLIRTNALRRWGRTTLTALGVAIGVMTVVALLSLTSGLSRSAGGLAKLGRADFGVFQSGLADLTASSLPPSIVATIRSVPGVADSSPVQIVPHAVAGESSMLVFGSEPESFLTRRLVVTAGRRGRGTEAMLGVRAASRLHAAPGSTLVIGGRPFSVAGVYRSGVSFEDDGVLLPLAVTQRAFHRGAEISMVAVSISPGYREADVERTVQRRVPGTVAIGDPDEVARVDTNSRVISKAAVVIAVLAVLVGAVVVTNTMAMSMMQRQAEFGLLAAVGWRRSDIARLIVGEGLAVSLVGTAAGLGLGIVAGRLLVEALSRRHRRGPGGDDLGARSRPPRRRRAGCARCALLRDPGAARAAAAGARTLLTIRSTRSVASRTDRSLRPVAPGDGEPAPYEAQGLGARGPVIREVWVSSRRDRSAGHRGGCERGPPPPRPPRDVGSARRSARPVRGRTHPWPRAGACAPRSPQLEDVPPPTAAACARGEAPRSRLGLGELANQAAQHGPQPPAAGQREQLRAGHIEPVGPLKRRSSALPVWEGGGYGSIPGLHIGTLPQARWRSLSSGERPVGPRGGHDGHLQAQLLGSVGEVLMQPARHAGGQRRDDHLVEGLVFVSLADGHERVAAGDERLDAFAGHLLEQGNGQLDRPRRLLRIRVPDRGEGRRA